MLRRHPLLVLSVCLVLAFSAPALSTSPEAGAPNGESLSPAPQLIVYCFHGKFRCFTCRKMEEYARDTLDENFADEIRSGRIVFQVINLAAPENQHFIADYQLDSWSVVLSLTERGKETKYRNLATIKNLVKDRQAFIKYLFGEIETLLGSS